jgi:hypothetical protein
MVRSQRRLALVALLSFACVGVALAQAEVVVYTTKAGTKYHRASCSSLRASKIQMPLAEAAKRYGPCGICQPPVVAAGAEAVSAARSSAPTATSPTGVSGSTPVMVSRSGSKGHREGCRTLRSGGIASTLGEASKKLGPCAVCKPPVLAAK